MISSADISAKLIGRERVRENSVQDWFSPDELQFIRSFPGVTLKEQVLRASGNGNCKQCNSPAPHQGKMLFAAYCTPECQHQNTKERNDIDRTQKLQLLKSSLELQGLALQNEDQYQNVASKLRVVCNSCEQPVKAQILRHILAHQCKSTILIPRKRIKRSRPSTGKTKKVKVQLCLDCKCERNPKSKPGRCMKCSTLHNRMLTGQSHVELLKDLGFSTSSQDAWDNHAPIIVTNDECGHTFTAQLGNILTGGTKCGVCGPVKRQQKRMNGYLLRNARQYDLREYQEYAKLIRNKSHANWRNEHGEIIGRRHAGVHLDHKVPIIYGFNERISPEVMSDLLNLQLLDYHLNISKGGRNVDFEVLERLREKYKETDWKLPLVQLIVAEAPVIRITEMNTQGDVINFPNSTLFVARNRRLSFGELPLLDHQKFMIVFEDELLDHRRRVIESMINHSMGNSKRIHARKCEIREVDGNQARRFMNVNHLSGAITASIRLGLFKDGILQCLLLCSKSRFDRQHEYEIVRFANRLDSTVVGGLTKLFSEFKRRCTPNSVMTYADRRFGNGGDVYKMLGMKLIRSTLPSTWWVKGQNRINSQDTRPEKIRKFLGEEYVDTLPVDVNMERANWVRIDDLGSNVFSWIKE